MPPQVASYLAPNYGEGLDETFSKATFASIASQRNMDILGMVVWLHVPQKNTSTRVNMTNLQKPKLPSWAVDFSNVHYFLFDSIITFVQPHCWDMSPTTQDHAKYLGQGRLSLTGFSLDQIDSVIHLPSTLDSDNEEKLCQFLSRAFQLAFKNNPAVLFDLDKGNGRNRKRPPTSLSELSKLIRSYKRSNMEFDYLTKAMLVWEEMAGFPRTSFKQTDYHSIYWYGNIVAYAHAVSGAAELFVTVKGFIGLAACGLAKGDNIVLLDGARLPVILSPQLNGHYFAFRGFTYVHGCMEKPYIYKWWRPRQPTGGTANRRHFVLQ